MAWIATDEDECIYIFPEKPYRNLDGDFWTTGKSGDWYQIPESVCEWILGKTLTWEDEPIEIGIKTKED